MSWEATRAHGELVALLQSVTQLVLLASLSSTVLFHLLTSPFHTIRLQFPLVLEGIPFSLESIKGRSLVGRR